MKQAQFVFLPGFMCDGRLFAAQAEALRKAGHVCFDGDLSGSETITQMAQAALEITTGPIVPVGLSMGGIVAFEMWRLAPGRVSQLALLNTTYHADRAGNQRIVQLNRVRRGELDLVLRDELKPNYLHPANRSESRLELLANMANELGDGVFERQTRALMARRSYADMLSAIHCPVSVIAGAQDSVCPPALHREMAQAIPDSQLTVIDQCGHLSPIEQPDEVTAALLDLVSRQAVQSIEQRA